MGTTWTLNERRHCMVLEVPRESGVSDIIKKTAMQLPTPASTPPASPFSPLEPCFDKSELNFRFDKLSPEVCSIVFNYLHDADWRAAHICRLVSRRFEAWATPVAYKKVEVNEKLLDGIDNDRNVSSVIHFISTYTRRLVVRSDLDSGKLQRLLALATHLKSFQWRCVVDPQDFGNPWPPLSVLQHIQPGTQLLVEDIPLPTSKGLLLGSHAGSLRSLLIDSGHSKFTRQLTPLKSILLRAINLETFHYQDHGYGCSFEFADGERLHAIKNLHLKSYHWEHSADQVRKHWDFSRIQSLCLTDVPMYAFLSSIPMKDFVNLHTLTMTSHNVYPDEEDGRKATELMATFIGKHLCALTSLEITCDVLRFPLDAIIRHKNTLQHLRMRDFTGFGEDDNLLCPKLAVGDVMMLARELTHVRTLELDLDTAVCDPVEFIQAIAGFQNLRELTIHTQAVDGHPFSTRFIPSARSEADLFIPDESSTAASTHDAALRIATNLLSELLDRGAKLRSHQDRRENMVLLQRVTVNIGGWRPVLLRRVAKTWKKKNQKGIFAERCFVLERDALQSSFSVTELVAIEPKVSSVVRRAGSLDDLLETASMIGVC